MATTTIASAATTRIDAGPLTTVFTTPDFCKSSYWSNAATPPLSSSICMPPRFQQYYEYSWGSYSPGICPYGYTQGCDFPTSLAKSSLGERYLGGPLQDGETALICCPTGYTCWTGSPSSYSECLSTNSITSYWSFDGTTEVPASTLAMAYAIQVRWQESDLSILETDPTVPGSKYSATATSTVDAKATGTTGVSASTATETSPSDGGLSSSSTGSMTTGATIAVVVAVPIVAVFLGSLAFFLWRYFYKKQQSHLNGDNSDGPQELDVGRVNEVGHLTTPAEMLSPISPLKTGEASWSEMGVSTMSADGDGKSIRETDARTMTELETMERPQELPDTGFVAELPGDMPTGWESDEVEHEQQTRFSWEEETKY